MKYSPPDLIITSDWHLREDTPVCRTDDFQKAQWYKVREVSLLQQLYECPVIHAGDLFDHWKPSPALLSQAFESLPNRFFTVYGQHDLPQHNLDRADKSGTHTLQVGGKITVLSGEHIEDGLSLRGIPWGVLPEQGDLPSSSQILVLHYTTWTGRRAPWPGCTTLSARELLARYPQANLIITGDNHQPFVEEHKGRYLINPGSLTRQTADQADHKPRVYLWWKEGRVKEIFLTIENEAVTREHLDRKQGRDERIEAFVSQLNTDWTADVNFEKSLERFFQENKVLSSVEQLVWKAVDPDGRTEIETD